MSSPGPAVLRNRGADSKVPLRQRLITLMWGLRVVSPPMRAMPSSERWCLSAPEAVQPLGVDGIRQGNGKQCPSGSSAAGGDIRGVHSDEFPGQLLRPDAVVKVNAFDKEVCGQNLTVVEDGRVITRSMLHPIGQRHGIRECRDDRGFARVVLH